MAAETADLIVSLAGLYLAIGLMVGLVFITLLLKRSSAGARTAAPLQFRILIFPASVVLWPIVLVRGLIGGAKAEVSDETPA
ncbi:hypothetical protein NHF40_05120 [Maricaulaceae bacterium EIL42A08]|nr:hypothetical protein [Maricaulaceae bacterium EIL42A08]MCP2678538.1 hypothetical protein [Maricaulaceae bacterium NA33B04]